MWAPLTFVVGLKEVNLCVAPGSWGATTLLRQTWAPLWSVRAHTADLGHSGVSKSKIP